MTSPFFYGCFGATQFDWLTNSVLLSQPIKGKGTTSSDVFTHVFPSFMSAALYLLRLPDWLLLLSASVVIGQFSFGLDLMVVL